MRRSSYGERNVEVCPGEEQAGDEAGTWDQRREGTHEVTQPLAATPIARGGWHAMEPELVLRIIGLSVKE